jgi:hypothetical protein
MVDGVWERGVIYSAARSTGLASVAGSTTFGAVGSVHFDLVWLFVVCWELLLLT